ncbi:histone-lysine N-methyltransferase ASH1L-like isoform X1 [Salvelinus fontinalis]|uniref:histone-lysine N-methyltransferase ASH1L-like isoform X1 n=1 Tax=Salvelinus fontinalis TaxID=8038 RepID=UPI00248642E5|nr:histone-lysine N-methyltransferase ASH1L-like isoform X1 [Salvelinus fontinalis]XP_055766810.1 histone-lysine N-methyltransferase ASH1L-like isoform X1 [Salvelinus fontinalis]XP_055766811.1 histone-lysine N-methyltransferase ASH1L-like isoform X1 [Salvelinus fontinalis]XP_055766812.1 histone-lysine N-methyltransferase ASH1L-like isoform X1 [Salvelinus fontinalis]
MDQRAKGGPSLPPPSSPPLLPTAPPQQYPEKEVGGGTRKRIEKEGGGAVLEVLIEGCCGAAGQRQLPFPGSERSCTEGNVRLRIGVQTAKRTKKPPRTLEGYECKPPIRTYQRPGRGAAGRGSQEGGGSGQWNSPQEEGDGEQNQGSDPSTTQTRKIHSSSPPSSSSSSSAPTTTPLSPANPQTAPAKQQVPVNLGYKKSDTLPEKPRHPDPPDAHSKLLSPAQMDQATPSDPTASSPHSPPPSSPHSPLVKDPSGEAGVKGEGGMLNGGVPTVTCHPTRLTKVKGHKQNCSSSAAPTNVNSTTRPPASSPHQADLAAQDRTTGFSCPPTPPPSTPLLPDQRGAPVADGRLSPAASLTSLSKGPLLPSSVGNERGKEEKAKKKKERDDKARGEKGKGKRGEKGRGKEDRGRNEKMDRDERGKEGTGMDESGRDMTGKEERNGDEDKEREKPRDLRTNKSPSSTKCQMLSDVQSRKTGTPSPDLTSRTGESDDTGAPSRPTVSPSNPSTASSPLTSLPPPSLSLHSSSPPTSPREQDSRPLKKRKTRRPSWTRLVNRAQRLAENPDGPQDAPLVAPQTPTTPQTSPTTPQTPATTNSPNLRSAESCLAPSVPPHSSPSSLSPSTSTPVRPRPAGRPPSPTQSHMLTSDPSPSPGPDRPVSQARKRGRSKSQTSSLDEPQPRHSPKLTRPEMLPHGHDETPDPHVLNPVLDHSPTLTNPSSPNPTPRKRGRPKRLPPSPLLPKQTLQDQNRDTLTPSGGEEGGKDFPSEKGNRKLRMRSIIGEMKRRKKRRLLREMLSGCGGGKEGRGREGGRESSRGCAGGVCGSATAPSLSSSFGGKLGPQINVSKRGNIYMGKRRGRKPKAPANSNPASQSTLFTSLSSPSLFSSPQPQPHPPLSHPFPSPSLTHSSGAQSPYSDGGCTEPAPSLFLPHTFSLPSPSSSCASPRPLSSFSSSSSLSPSLKRSSPGQGRHPLFHHPSSRLSSPPLPHPLYPHLPVFPTHLKETTHSPISKSHSKEMLPSDSVIGMDHNTISERGERRGRGRGGVTMGMTSDVTRSVFRTGLGVNLKGQRQPSPSMLLEHPPPVPSPIRVSASPPSPPSASPRHTPPSDLVEPRDRHRRRGYECPYTCPPCPCLGHNQRSHLALCPCPGHNTHKRQKHKRKRKYQHLLMHAHDPDFLSELDDLIGQFSKVRIGRHRDWARAGLGQDLDESGGKRRHSSLLSSQNFHSNVYRINLSGYYSPHPLSYPPHPSLSPLHPHPCHGLLNGSRKPEQRLRCGCPTKPCESLDQGDCGQGRRCALQGITGHLHPSSLSTPLSSSTTSSTTPMPLGFGYYRGYPLTMAHYPNPHPSFPLPPPHPYAPHHPHLQPPHLLLNPARFHRRRSRQLREAGLGGGGGEDVGVRGEGKRAGVRSCPAGSIPGRSCVYGGSEHKLRHKHRHRQRDHDGKEEEDERVAGSQLRSEFTTGSGGSRKTGGQGSAGLMESPWQHRHGKYPSFFSASAKPASSSSSSSERLKHTPLTCLGSSHLSSFGEGWGVRQNPWLRTGGLGAGFRPPEPTWGTLTEGQRTAAVWGSEREAGERHTPCHSTFTPPTHTNLFTSSATSGRGMRSGKDNWRPGSQDGSLRSEKPSQTERRGADPHYDLSRRQLKWLRTGQSFGAKRGPGRPRKKPLAPPLVYPFLCPTSQPNPPTETDVQNRDRNRGGGDSVQEVIEAVIQSQRRRRRKRRHIEKEEVEHPSCLQSSGEGEPVTHTPSICTGQSELTQTPSLTSASQSDKGADQLPRKRFQRAGLYSDDYKTTDPSSQNQLNRERLEYTPGEQDYSLLPAPIHVGKYLRMRRIDFQLPFDVMWLFRHNQLHKEPDVPLTREISSYQPKEKSLSSHQTGVSLPPSPQEECSSHQTGVSLPPSPQEKGSSPSRKLFPYLDMEPMTTSDGVFVLKHHVFLLRNWERVRDRQIRLRRGREGEREKDGGGAPSYVATGDNNSHIMSGRQMAGKKKVVVTSESLRDPQCPHNPLSTTPHLTENRQEEKKQVEEERWREVRKERLNNILLKLRQT